MNDFRTKRPVLRRQVLAALSAPLIMAASSQSGAVDPEAQPDEARQRHLPGAAQVYSVINVGPDELGAYLNERGQAAFSSFVYYNSSFFDGERVHELGSLDDILIRGLNNRGTITGVTHDDALPFSNPRAFSWTLAGGLRMLPGLGAFPSDINDSNQIVGQGPEANTTGRAVRWDADGRIRPLGPTPPSQSNAHAINNRGLAGGFADLTVNGRVQAVLWDAAGRQTGLGSLGGTYASVDLVNDRGEAAGQVFDEENEPGRSFFWSARSGMVPLTAAAPDWLSVSDLNEHGNVAGVVFDRADPAIRRAAFRWSLTRGLEWLAPPPGPGVTTDVTDLNNRNQMVGSVGAPGSGERAVRWDWSGPPVDLNRLLYRPPAGLVLYSGKAINDAGTILAYSSAGLVMLRPGTRGTDAPVLGPITGLANRADVGQEALVTVGFVDSAPGQTHSAAVTWSDGCTSPHPLVQESRGVGQVSARHRFCTPGMFDVRVRVLDSGGRATSVATLYIVEDPALPAISGQGVLGRAGEAPGATQAVRFAMWAPLARNGARPSSASAAGRPVFRLAGAFQFVSDQVVAVRQDGRHVRLEGTGRFNGRGGHRFLAEGGDGAPGTAAGNDWLRVRIGHLDPSGTEVIDYDSGAARAALAEGELAIRN